MMQELIDTLNDKQASLVILHEGKIHSFGGHGVRHLYNKETSILDTIQFCPCFAVSGLARACFCSKPA